MPVTRYDAQVAAERMGHKLKWNPLKIPGDIANGFAFCQDCGMYVLSDRDISGPAVTCICAGPSASVNSYMFARLMRKSPVKEMGEIPCNSYIGLQCVRLIDAAVVLCQELVDSTVIDMVALQDRVVIACEEKL